MLELDPLLPFMLFLISLYFRVKSEDKESYVNRQDKHCSAGADAGNFGRCCNNFGYNFIITKFNHIRDKNCTQILAYNTPYLKQYRFLLCKGKWNTNTCLQSPWNITAITVRNTMVLNFAYLQIPCLIIKKECPCDLRKILDWSPELVHHTILVLDVVFYVCH